MRTISLSTSDASSGAVSSSIAVMDVNASPFNVGMGFVVTGTVNYTIQHTFDDVLSASVTPTWFSHPTLAAITASADGNYAFPVRGIKILQNSGDGSIAGKVIQAGQPGLG